MEDLIENTVKEFGDAFDGRALAGQAYISKNWRHLLPTTRSYFASNGYDEFGRFVDTDDAGLSDARHLEYTLGLLHEAVTSKVPSKKGDPIPACFAGDDVLNHAPNLLAVDGSGDPAFVGLAIHALLKQQTARALEFLFFSGGTNEVTTKSAIWEIGKAIGKAVLLIGLPVSIGGGLAYASEGNGVAASLCAYFAFAAVSTYRTRNAVVAAKELDAYRKWSSLLYRDFHIGTGHGLRLKLEEMVRQDIHVPSVLIDLCSHLHRRSA